MSAFWSQRQEQQTSSRPIKQSDLWVHGATHAGFSARNQRSAELIDPLRPHTLVVDFDVKPTHLEACHVGHQKGIGAQWYCPAGIRMRNQLATPRALTRKPLIQVTAPTPLLQR